MIFLANSKYGLIALSAVAFAVMAVIVHSAGILVTSDFFKDPAYAGMWNPFLKTATGLFSSLFFMELFAFNLVVGIAFAVVFFELRDILDLKTGFRKGLHFGVILFLVNVVPSAFGFLAFFNVPVVLAFWWGIQYMVVSLLGGLIFSSLLSREA